MSWDDIKEGADSDFTKIEAGSKVRVHILGEPKKHYTHFVNKKASECGGEMCSLCAGGDAKKARYSMPVYNMTIKKKQTMEQGISVPKQILEIKDAYKGTLEGVDLVISREGAGPNDTKYTVVPVPTEYIPF